MNKEDGCSREFEIRNALSQLEDSIETRGELCTRLVNRLLDAARPVEQPKPSAKEDSGEGAPPIMTELGGKIYSMFMKMDDINNTMANLLDRLEI